MPKTSRLSRADFTSLGSSRRVHGSFFVLAVSNTPEMKLKFACVVSKKVALRANVRNLIKRRCRAVFRVELAHLPSDRQFIFTAKKQAKGASFPEIKADIAKLLAQAAR